MVHFRLFIDLRTFIANFYVEIYALFPQIFCDWKADSANFFAFRMYDYNDDDHDEDFCLDDSDDDDGHDDFGDDDDDQHLGKHYTEWSSEMSTSTLSHDPNLSMMRMIWKWKWRLLWCKMSASTSANDYYLTTLMERMTNHMLMIYI